MNIVVVGHVDHGKSTIVGRLLADTGTLPEGKLEQVRQTCARNAKPFEYAFLIDALKAEQDQGITIDSARVFFRTKRRPYIIIDAPGHLEFLKNMVTGAARAEAALLVVDAREGMQENTRRHARLLPLLGVRHIAVLVNKIDLVGNDEVLFRTLEADMRTLLSELGVEAEACIPVSGREGTNLIGPATETPWYSGPSVVEYLDALADERQPTAQPFRMPVQGIYKFTESGDERRIIAGAVASGVLRVGDAVVFYPSGKHSQVRSLESFNTPAIDVTEAGAAAGFTLADQIFVSRGEVACRQDEARPEIAVRLRVSLFWLAATPLVQGKTYQFKLGTASVGMEVESVDRIVDAAELDARDRTNSVVRNEVAECIVRLHRPVAVDPDSDVAATSRFVIVDDWEIRGGGIVRERLPDSQAAVREGVLVRNAKWEPSRIQWERRAVRYKQLPAVVIITGPSSDERKQVARALEAQLFDDNHLAYFLGIGNLLYGVDADLERSGAHRHEHLRRLAEVANLMLDAGMLLVVTCSDLTPVELELIETPITPGRVLTVWIGAKTDTELAYDLDVPDGLDEAEQVARILLLLRQRDIVSRA